MIFKNIFVYPRCPENLKNLYELAHNLWSTWDFDALGLFYRIDTRLFREVKHNPVNFLHRLSKDQLKTLSNDKGFLCEFEKVWEKFQNYLQHTDSFKDQCAEECDLQPDDIIAYFSMEFGLHECIPIYAGGLGLLAGDFLKGVSDLDMPVIGIGLLYKYGYFTQHIDPNGYQQEVFEPFENHLIPIKELHDANGNWAHITVKILDQDVKVKLWNIDVGKSRLILLDTDIEDNPPNLRDITNELYVSDHDKRIQQELIFGIGGIRALDFLGINVRIYHFNEGHSAFAILGRLQDLIENRKFSFSEARAIIRASTVFTTHTPVIAGNENFDTDMVKKYIKQMVEDMGLTFDQIGQFGYVDNKTDVFWLPAFAMNFSKFVNAVSQQHAKKSRRMWASLFHQRPLLEVPITFVTNGVHGSWISPPFVELFNRYMGPDYVRCGERPDLWENIYNIPDEHLWEQHRRNKKDMVNFIRRYFTGRLVAGSYYHAKKVTLTRILDPDRLTVVFARRFAAYKRPTLILRDKQRLKNILTDSAKPVQLIFTGKAHPADNQGKEMIKEVIDFAIDNGVEDRMIFLENYDINIARHLCWGADIWLNNPVFDLEACGTSGMKAAMNAVLHLSTLEGWWREGYNGKNGWAITAGSLYKNPDLQDAADAYQLYELLEHEVSEMFYDRNEFDIPVAWVKMMRESLLSVCRHFNINRMLCDYIKNSYIPSKIQSQYLAQDDYSLLKQAVQEAPEVIKYFDDIKLTNFSTNIEKKDQLTEGELVEVRCRVDFGKAQPKMFAVELFYIFDNHKTFKVLPMHPKDRRDKLACYTCKLPIEGYGPQSLNVRIRPANQIVADIHPELIKWK